MASGPEDVRMRGFRDRRTVEELQAWVDGLDVALDVGPAALEEAAGRVLAEDLRSDVDVPSFDRAQMDGWAVRGADTLGASETEALPLSVVGVALPGRPCPCAVGPGEAVRIMTGAPMPAGADAVLPAEHGEERDAALEARAGVPPGRHVGPRGEDVRAGRLLLAAGRCLRPQDVGLAASVGRGTLGVRRRPRVAIVATGDELLPPGTRPSGSSIADANSPMLAALVRRDGGEVALAQRVRDDAVEVARAMAEAPGDALLVTGGSSVGQEDHAPTILARDGELRFHGVALRPASPAGAGRLGGRAVFLLPGNPVSCLCAYDLFAGRLVRRLAGRGPEPPYPRRRVRLVAKVASALGRVDYVRVAVAGAEARPIMARGASILSSTTEADGYLLVPRDLEGYAEGAEVEVRLYDAAGA